MPVASAGGREHVRVVVGDHTRAVYTRPLHLKSRQSMQSMHSGRRQRSSWDEDWEIMMHELSMGELRGIKLHTTVPYQPASNGVAECRVGVLINAARTSHGRVQVGYRRLCIF